MQNRALEVCAQPFDQMVKLAGLGSEKTIARLQQERVGKHYNFVFVQWLICLQHLDGHHSSIILPVLFFSRPQHVAEL